MYFRIHIQLLMCFNLSGKLTINLFYVFISCIITKILKIIFTKKKWKRSKIYYIMI